jgi:N-methylhydantoinase A/oxoprolinase/acetone carboxylase beta subunit
MLIEAVSRSMAALGIQCPLMIVKGDGTLSLAQSVVQRPIETVLSGPAASLVGAAWLSGLKDFILADMGGTTTDLGLLLDGRPRVAEEGAEVGGWRTMVKAIDVKTIGLGGDSEVHIGLNGKISVGPERAVPVSLIGARYPEVISMLEADLADTEGGSMHGKFVVKPFGAVESVAPAGLSARETEILSLITDRPKPLRRVAVSSSVQRALAALRRKGLVQLCAFTPSDAAHALGLQANWSRQAADLAAGLAVRFMDMKAGSGERIAAFCQDVWSETVRRSARVILDLVLGPVEGGESLLDAACNGAGEQGFAKVVLSPKLPVVAVGGPVKIYYDEVGRRLQCKTVYPPFFDVANAVGAASAVVAERATVSVEGDGSGLFRVYGPDGVLSFGAGGEALARAQQLARDMALRAAAERGAEDVEISLTIEKAMLPDAVDDNGLLTAQVTAEAIGRPRLGESY